MQDRPSKYRVTDTKEIARLIKARFKTASRLREKWAAEEWTTRLDSWGKEEVLNFCMGPDVVTALMTVETDEKKQDQGTRANYLDKENEKFPRLTAWKAAVLLGDQMIQEGLSFLDVFTPVDEVTAQSEPTSARGKELSGYTGWYLSHRPTHKKRRFGLIKIFPKSDGQDLCLDGYTFDDRLDVQQYPTTIWHSTDCVVNPGTGVGFYTYSGWPDGKDTIGYSKLRFGEAVEGIVHSATGSSLDNQGRYFEIRLERLNVEEIGTRLDRETPLNLETPDDRLAVIKYFHELYPRAASDKPED